MDKIEQPDYSEQRNKALQDLLNSVHVFTSSDIWDSPIQIKRSDLKPIDSYLTIHGTRALGALITDSKMDIASAAILKPIAGFRDFLKNESSNESTILEYYFSKVILRSGKKTFALCIVRRNVIAKVLVSDKPEDLISLINGLQFYKAY